MKKKLQVFLPMPYMSNVPSCSVLYVCCRDSSKKRINNRPNKSGQTRKRVSSCKLESFCIISRMMATEDAKNGNVKVTYITSHTNHELGIKECKHLPLPLSVKNYIQEQFSAGVSLEHVLDGSIAHYNQVIASMMFAAIFRYQR